MESKHDKAELACLKIQLEALKRGYIVSKPTKESSRYDFILDDGKALKRVQVKYSGVKPTKAEGSVQINLGKGRHAGERYYYDATEVDLVLAYLPQVDKIVCLKPDQFSGRSTVYVRYAEAKNGQNKGCLLLKDCVW